MPLASFLGIQKSPLNSKLLLLSYQEAFRNHLNTFHGSIIYSLAEISAGYFLAKNFRHEQEITISVLRRSQIKYVAPSQSELHSSISLPHTSVIQALEELYEAGKILIIMRALIHDESGKLIFKGDFEWFVTVKPEYLKVSKSLTDLEK